MGTFEDLHTSLLSGDMTCVEITDKYLESIEENRSLNAFLSVFVEDVRERARLIDQKVKEGKPGPLAGMVVAVKDNICVKGFPATCASKILENFVAPYDATVIKRLRDADALIIGKTNLDEFAMGSSTENSGFGRVKLQSDESRVPGGSSGGSAVAVAVGMCTTSLGSDTGGSIRQPASFTGIAGLKPTYGRVSRYGLVAFASSFDQIGPFGRSVRDCATVLKVIAGYDDRDSTSARIPVPDYSVSITKEVKGVRVGIPREFFDEALNPEIRSALEKKIDLLCEHGAVVVSVSLPHTEYTIATYYILATAEASSNLARYDGVRYGYRTRNAKDFHETYTLSRSEGFGAEVKRRIMLGTYVLSAGYYDAYYKKGQKVRRLIKEDYDKAFERVDVLISPTTPSTAFKAGEKIEDPLQMYLSDIYTTSANLAGVPAISIPCGVDRQNLPIGLQVTGKQFDESTILRVADFLESID